MDVESFHATAKDRYWKGKDLAAARRFLEGAITLARAESLRLARRLQKGDEALADDGFTVGANYLARGRFDEAKEGGMEDHVLLAAGYSVLAMELLRGRSSVRFVAEQIRSDCQRHGDEFADRLLAAARVFAP